MVQVHGGRLVAIGLKRHGVRQVFTLCGGHIQAIYDGCLDEDIRVVDVRHEQTAGHAAEGVARISGRPGVALVTAGPGVTDTVTALANAQRSGTPLVCLGGAGPHALADKGSLQDMDSVALMRSVSKWSVRVTETSRIVEYVDSAFRVAQNNTPGPVYLEIPLDTLMGVASDELPDTSPQTPLRPGPQPAQVDALAELFERSERPCFIIGSQLRWSPDGEALRSFSDAVRTPVFLNGMARGALPFEHDCLFARSRRTALKQSDLVVLMGTPLDFRLDYGRKGTWNPDGKLVQVDLNGELIGQNRAVDLGIQADSGLVLTALSAKMGSKQWPDWLSELRQTEQKKRAAMEIEIAADGDPPNPLRVCDEVSRRLGPMDVVIGDGGDFVATAAYTMKLAWPQVWMDPGPLGTLGIGPGYAMAAQAVRPGARTVVMFGDGAFGLHAMEFEALVRQEMPVVAIIGNDAAWTQIRRGQVQLYGEQRAVATGLSYTRYDQVVEAVGGKGLYVETTEELGPALDEAFSSKLPACVNVKIASSDFRKGAISV